MLRVEGLCRAGTFEDVSFEVHAGEVVGFAGLVGAGRTDVGLALFGIAPAERGTIAVDGKPWSRSAAPATPCASASPTSSEDRRRIGLSMPQSVASNITLPRLRSYRTPFGLLDRRAEDAAAGGSATALRIRTASLRTPVGNLSGGNQQKTMLAKWLNAAPRVLVLDEPTRGIDVGAKADVHELIDDLARDGVAVDRHLLRPAGGAGDERPHRGDARGQQSAPSSRHDDADPERVMAAAVA